MQQDKSGRKMSKKALFRVQERMMEFLSREIAVDIKSRY